MTEDEGVAQIVQYWLGALDMGMDQEGEYWPENYDVEDLGDAVRETIEELFPAPFEQLPDESEDDAAERWEAVCLRIEARVSARAKMQLGLRLTTEGFNEFVASVLIPSLEEVE